MKITIPGLLLINGGQGLGKSHLIKYLISTHKDKFDYGLVFCNTSFDISDKSSFDYIPKKYVHAEYDEVILSKFMDIQAKLVKQGIVKEAFIIFDDCLDIEMFNTNCFKRLVTQLRHYHITVFLSTQYPNAVSPRTRNNCMQVVIFYTDTEVALKALHGSFGQQWSFKEFKKLVMDSCIDHAFLYYNKKEQDPKIRYQVLRAPKTIKSFKVTYNTSIT